jgi:hypothetical protein
MTFGRKIPLREKKPERPPVLAPWVFPFTGELIRERVMVQTHGVSTCKHRWAFGNRALSLFGVKYAVRVEPFSFIDSGPACGALGAVTRREQRSTPRKRGRCSENNASAVYYPLPR